MGDPEDRMRFACAKGKIDMVQSLLDGGVNVKAVDPMDGRTFFHVLAEVSSVTENHLQIVDLLVNRGANVNSKMTGALRCVTDVRERLMCVAAR